VQKEVPSYPIASVDNALRLLALFRDRPRLRVTEVSELLGVAHSTAHRLLAMLAYHGFVQQDADSKAYLAGPSLVEIGLAAVRRIDLRSLVRPLLDDLAAAFDETVHLVVLDGPSVRYLDASESTRALRVAARTGSVLPASCTASGKAMLACLPAADLRVLFPPGRALPLLTRRSVATTAELDAELAAIRARGYAVNAEESEDGVASVAVALAVPPGLPGALRCAALAVSGPVARLTDEVVAHIAARLQADSARIVSPG